MPLQEVEIAWIEEPIPDDVTELIREANLRIDRFVERHLDTPVPGFVPSDFADVYAALRHVASSNLLPGGVFCEWGSGFGVVTLLASTLGFEAHGIEIESELVDEARSLADDFSIEAEFAHGSYIPRGGDCYTDELDLLDGPEWLTISGLDGYEELGISPGDIDVVFVYPWPGEDRVVGRLFDRYAADGSLLLTHRGLESTRLNRKVSPRRSR